MRSIYYRLETVKYQKLKKYRALTTQEAVVGAQGVFDAAINVGSSKPSDVVLPVNSLGVAMTWNPAGTGAYMLSGEDEITDDFTDIVIPEVDPSLHYFTVNGDFLLVNGDNLKVNS
jgi:hypothetical protein